MLCNDTFRYRRWYAVLALVAAFVGGWVTAGTQYASEVDRGLVTAFNSVGQNLFGSAVFSAVPPNPVILDPGHSPDPVRVFFSGDTRIPVVVDVFFPPNPITPASCRVYAQLSVGSEGVRLMVDPDVAPDRVPVEYASLLYERPNISGC